MFVFRACVWSRAHRFFKQKIMVHSVPSLDRFGPRIAIIGPSNSGKSTLARAVGEKIGAPCYHLDQYSHIPGTNWVRRPDTDFVADHDKLIKGDAWIIDGNYSVCMKQRLERATGAIWIDPPILGSIWRYLIRSSTQNGNHIGRLDGATKDFNWFLVWYTLTGYPKKRPQYEASLKAHPHLVRLDLSSFTAVKRLYRDWGLDRP